MNWSQIELQLSVKRLRQYPYTWAEILDIDSLAQVHEFRIFRREFFDIIRASFDEDKDSTFLHGRCGGIGMECDKHCDFGRACKKIGARTMIQRFKRFIDEVEISELKNLGGHVAVFETKSRFFHYQWRTGNKEALLKFLKKELQADIDYVNEKENEQATA